MQQPVAADVSLPATHGADMNGAVRSPSPDRSSTGFTAVNGLHKKPALFRPNEVAHPVAASADAETAIKTPSGVTHYHSHGWRPDDSHVHERHNDARHVTGKRKRSDQYGSQVEENAQSPVHDAIRNGSPGYRLAKLDSAIDLSSPGNQNQSAALSSIDSDSSDAGHIGSYQREKSPVERWNKGDPPPKPRPETEASLAASLQQFQQQTQQVQEAQPNRSFSPRYASPPDEGDHILESQIPSDDQYSGDVMDPKRRKRNFSNRTKTGCHTCRKRKKKCDEGKPTCQNCERGNFQCEGYGPKPPGFKLSNQTRTVIPLQSKTPMAPYNGRQTDAPPTRSEEGLSYSHWGRVPPAPASAPAHPPPPPPPPPAEPEPPRQFVPVAPADPRRPNTADNWQKPAYTPHEHPPPPYQNERPAPNFPLIPSLQPPYSHDHRQHQQPPMHAYGPPHHGPPPHQTPSSRHHPPSHPPPVPMEPWAQHPVMATYPHPNAPPPQGISSRGSVASGSQRSDGFPIGYASTHSQVEKEKMLRGQPFMHYLDQVLIQDRSACKAAVERYNKAAETTSGISVSERGKLFTQILKPHKRADAKTQREQPTHAVAPVGSIEDHSVVESPFMCEYGYNIHIGRDCVVERGCFFQDAADIFLGARVMIGHNVKLYCITVPLDTARKGSHTTVVAGAIKIDDDCFIGAETIIMPFVTIGRGAVVGAGSVVTKDVEENTVVAGNPAKLIRRIEGSNMGRHHSQQIQRQQDKMVNWMVGYANSGFSWYTSPRL